MQGQEVWWPIYLRVGRVRLRKALGLVPPGGDIRPKCESLLEQGHLRENGCSMVPLGSSQSARCALVRRRER
jgi:hypothetical protein